MLQHLTSLNPIPRSQLNHGEMGAGGFQEFLLGNIMRAKQQQQQQQQGKQESLDGLFRARQEDLDSYRQQQEQLDSLDSLFRTREGHSSMDIDDTDVSKQLKVKGNAF